MSNFEKKFGKYAIKNLSLILIMCYACGYLMKWINPGFFTYLYLNPYEIIHHFQIWRLVTWLIVPPDSFDFWTLLMLYFYYSIGTSLERTWGTYRYNVYIFSGILFTAAGAFILYGVSSLLGAQSLGLWMTVDGYITYPTMFSTYYVNMSIFLAYAATFPDYEVLLFFILPIKVKFLGIIYGAMLIYQFIVGYGTSSALFYYNLGIRFVITASLLNFVVFFFTSRKKVRRGPIKIIRQQAVKQQPRHETKKSSGITRHKCAVCGRTDETNPELEFRFCSKCNGNYEYCQDHLFTHTHVQ
ncbi:MAG: hypothetical protein Q4E29_00795 [Lachnospiraceae bacterium]|nr:hypothetical protein [Lachnospiraceae bacterium]